MPCVEVYDYPSLKYRGVLIDVCRHFFSVEEIKKQIRIMGMLKLNKLHLHLTDNQAWRIEIRKYPELIQNSAVAETYNGSKYGPFYYTQEDLKEIIAYAAQHQVEVIPEIEFPGHSLSALVAFPELSCSGGPFVSEQVFGFEENVFCVGNEKVYGFMQDVLRVSGPIYSTSVNFSGERSLLSFDEIFPVFSDLVDFAVEDPSVKGGMASTLVDATVFPYRVIRQGTYVI